MSKPIIFECEIEADCAGYQTPHYLSAIDAITGFFNANRCISDDEIIGALELYIQYMKGK